MSWVDAALFGALQGLTEFLPVSSSGHIAVLKYMFHVEEVSILFDVLLHTATLLVIIAIFRKKLVDLFSALFKGETSARMLCVKLIFASSFTACIGFGIRMLQWTPSHRALGLHFLITASLLLFSCMRRGKRMLQDIRYSELLLLGIVQGFAVLPGISRSGVTIATMLLLGFEERASLEFSFLLAIPAIFGALLLVVGEGELLIQQISIGALLLGMLTASVVGYLGLKLLLRYVRNIHYFAGYLFALATLLFLF